MNPHPRIVFFGTPEIAVVSLKRLIEAQYLVAAAVTAPDRPSGRGLKLKVSPVKEYALSLHLPVLQPVNMKDPGFVEQLASLCPDLQIVIAFRMMPRVVWNLPKLGTFNLHASLLPQYRGAAPINWTVINGETETGVTTFFLNEHIDTGKIIYQEKVGIGAEETAGELHDRLAQVGSGLVLKTVDGICHGTIAEIPQDSLTDTRVPLKTAPKIFKEDCRIRWDRDLFAVHNHIRGLSPHPGAFTIVRMPDGTTQILKIYRTTPEPATSGTPPGQFLSDGKTFLKVAVKNGFIHLQELQLAGRKTMNTADFLRGFGWMFA